MADVKLNADRGYGQLELNQVAFRRDGRIEAQCKIAPTIDYVENGTLLAIYNEAHTYTVGSASTTLSRTVTYPEAGAKMFGLNYSAEHLYDERKRGLKDFKLDRNTQLPRLGYLSKGDKFTTNAVIYDSALTLAEGCIAYQKAGDQGYWRVVAGSATISDAVEGAPKCLVTLVTTMPDGAPALKLECIAD